MRDILTLEQNDLKAFATRLYLALDAGEVGVRDWNIEPNITLWDDRMFEMQVIKRTHDLTMTNEKLKLEIIGRKKVELELLEREVILEHAQRMAKVGSWQWDIPNNEFTFSKQWKLNHGVTTSTLSMEDLIPIAHPDDAEAIKKAFQDVLDEVEPTYDLEHRIIRQDNGEVRYMHASGEVLDRDDSGKALKMIGFAQDITALKTAQDEMAQSESHFRAVMESVPLSIFVSTGENQESQFLNKSFIDMFGYTLEELPSVLEWFLKAYPEKDYRESLVPEWQARVKATIASKKNIVPMDSVVTCKDGTTKDIRWGYISLDKFNYAFGLDITKQKQAEDERVKLHESQVALKKEREKQKIFTATVSATQHILNNLLNNMLLFKMKAKQSDCFDDKTKTQFDQAIKEGTELVKKLGAVEVLTEENIKASVNPKSDK
jgi:PAS domain S-box-containing protein